MEKPQWLAGWHRFNPEECHYCRGLFPYENYRNVRVMHHAVNVMNQIKTEVDVVMSHE